MPRRKDHFTDLEDKAHLTSALIGLYYSGEWRQPGLRHVEVAWPWSCFWWASEPGCVAGRKDRRAKTFGGLERLGPFCVVTV